MFCFWRERRGAGAVACRSAVKTESYNIVCHQGRGIVGGQSGGKDAQIQEHLNFQGKENRKTPQARVAASAAN